MIIWINGAFGVGKTQTAYELQRRTENSEIFDPEKIGYFFRKLMPHLHGYSDFQNIPIWKSTVVDCLNLYDSNDKILIVPMTIVDDSIFDFIFGKLTQKDKTLHHYTLMASKEIIEKRLERRGDKNSWNFKQVDRCLNSLSKDKYAKHINTNEKNLDEAVEYIANDIGLQLHKKRLSKIESAFFKTKVTIENIR